MTKRIFLYSIVFYFVISASACLTHASYIYPLAIFTDNGAYYNSADLNLYVEVSQGLSSLVDFTFRNESIIDSSVARIYFDNDMPLDVTGITNGDGAFFNQSARPGNLPAGNSLDPPFMTTDEISFASGPPRPHNGINPGQWVTITFDVAGFTFADVIDGLDAGDIRIGAHVIALPDGSSESALSVPEPTTACLLLGLGTMMLLRRNRK